MAKTKKNLADEQDRAREERLVDVLMAGIKARSEHRSIREEDVLAAGKAAYKKDPTKGGH